MPSGGQNKIYSPEVCDQVVKLMSEGKTVSEIAKEIGCNVSTIQTWRLTYPSFDAACSRAQDLGYEIQADSLLTIPDEVPDVQRARLKSENLRWVLARRAAHRYGDRLEINVNKTVDIGGALEEARRRALAPISNPDNVVDTQCVDITDAITHEPTGKESDTPKTRDASTQDQVDDLLS